MAVYVVHQVVVEQRGVESERFELTRDGRYVMHVDKPKVSTMDAWRAAVRMLRTNLSRRIGDDAPVFAANSNEQECVAFAEMLNA